MDSERLENLCTRFCNFGSRLDFQRTDFGGDIVLTSCFSELFIFDNIFTGPCGYLGREYNSGILLLDNLVSANPWYFLRFQ